MNKVTKHRNRSSVLGILEKQTETRHHCCIPPRRCLIAPADRNHSRFLSLLLAMTPLVAAMAVTDVDSRPIAQGIQYRTVFERAREE